MIALNTKCIYLCKGRQAAVNRTLIVQKFTVRVCFLIYVLMCSERHVLPHNSQSDTMKGTYFFFFTDRCQVLL